MREPSREEETAYSVASTAKKGFNGLSFRWLGVAAVIVLLGVLFILFRHPNPGAASPPSHTSQLTPPCRGRTSGFGRCAPGQPGESRLVVVACFTVHRVEVLEAGEVGQVGHL